MRVGRFIKRLISPDAESEETSIQPDAEGADRTAAPAAYGGSGEGSTSFIQAESEIVSAVARETGAKPPDSVVSAPHDDPPAPVAAPDSGLSVEPESEPEAEPVSDPNRMFATDSELREAGINLEDQADADPEDAADEMTVDESEPELEPESEPEPEVHEEEPTPGEVVSAAPAQLETAIDEEPSAPSEPEQDSETEPSVVSATSADNQPEPESPATPEPPAAPEPPPAPEPPAEHEPLAAPELPVTRPISEDELSLARSAVNTGFVITLATELRTPISSLRVSFDLLKDPEAIRNNPVESKRLVGNIERSIARLERQASDLLEVGYIHTGSLTLLKQPIIVSEPVLAAIDISRSTAALRQVAIELEMEPDLPRAIADGFRLTQIMTHLLSNAIKFAPVGESVVISLETGLSSEVDGPSGNPGTPGENQPQTEEADADSLIVRVIDHGLGTREAHFERIFEPFYRITDEGTEGGAGVGLGLAIVKGLVELHSGKVWVKSVPHEVTEFGSPGWA